MMHQLIVLGRLGGDPELKYTPAGKAVCNVSVAVTEKWGDNETTVWYRGAAWDKRAEALSKFFNKGDMIMLAGRPKAPGAWTSNGEARAQNEFTIDQFSFVGAKKDGSGGGGSRPATPSTDSGDVDLGDGFGADEIPF